MTDQEIVLSGGNVSTVVRIGETVRRPLHWWSEAVHGLLHHLELQNFDSAPHFLGVDAQGREMLTFMAGEVGHYPLPLYIWPEEVLQEVAQLLRRYHDTTASYVAPPDARWQFVYPDKNRHEVICHNDFAPYNLVFAEKHPKAIIDFDTVGPGPRAWDLAYAAYRFVPFSYTQDMQDLGLADPASQERRLRLFCDAYGFADPQEILHMIVPRLQAMCTLIIEETRAGNPAFQKMLDEGHLTHYQNELATFRRLYKI